MNDVQILNLKSNRKLNLVSGKKKKGKVFLYFLINVHFSFTLLQRSQLQYRFLC